MSGGKSRSSTSSSTSSQVDNSNTQINDNEGTVLNLARSSGNRITVNETDNEVVDRSLKSIDSTVTEAFEFGDDALSSVDNTVDEAFSFGDTALEESFDFGRDAIKETQSFGKSVIEEAQEFGKSALSSVTQSSQNAVNKIATLVSEANLGDAERTRQIVVAVLAGVVILAAIALLTRFR